MIREDLICALRNAIERGSSLDEAITTLENAGYNRIDIEEASRQLRDVRKKGSFLPPPPKRK